MRISDWSSDVCSSDLDLDRRGDAHAARFGILGRGDDDGVGAEPGAHHLDCFRHGLRMKGLEPHVALPLAERFDLGLRMNLVLRHDEGDRSEAPSEGKEWVRTCKGRWWPSN